MSHPLHQKRIVENRNKFILTLLSSKIQTMIVQLSRKVQVKLKHLATSSVPRSVHDSDDLHADKIKLECMVFAINEKN